MASRMATWRHPITEGLAVLLGILIAFGIDAWWQERTDRATERDLLQALRGELVDAQEGFEQHSASLDADINLSVEVIRVLSSPEARAISNDSLHVLTRRMVPPLIYQPPRAALDDLTGSGGIGLIQSDPLRRAVGSYRQVLEEDRRIQELLLDIWLVHLAPYLYEHSTLTQPPQGVSSRVPILPPLPIRVDREAYVGNRTYQNLVAARAFRIQDVRRSHDVVLQSLARVVTLLDGE